MATIALRSLEALAMGGKLAVFALAFVFSSLGLNAQNDYSVSFSDYTYNGSNGCSSFGACDRNYSTVTDTSALQSSGWQYVGNSWQVAFTPGQLQSLGPSFADQFYSIQTSIQQAYQNAISDAQAAFNEENISEAKQLIGHITAETVLEHSIGSLAEFGFSYASAGLELAPQVGTQAFPPIIFDPAFDSPLPARINSGNPSPLLGNGPFSTVDPTSATIIDPRFSGDPSTIIDLNTDAEAQQMLLNAKQSQQSLLSEQQQLQSQASQYQSQNQQAIQQSDALVQAATNYALSNAAGSASQHNVQSGNAASIGNALQKAGQSSQPLKGPPVPTTQPSPEAAALSQLVNNIKAANSTPPASLGPTGVTCQTVGPKKIVQCTGTLPSYMTPPK
jgi:hypothetical protein